ncbi:MAG: cell division protein FtsZ, partial [Hyphomicrobium sp.]
VMGEMGKAMMGTGEASGENRALRAAEAAISNPLLEDTSMKGAKGVLINITGGLDMTLFEVDQAANRIREEVDPDAQIKVGSTLSENLDGVIRVSVIATGIEAQALMAAAHAAQTSATAAAAPGPGSFRTVNAPKPQQAPPHGGFFTTPTPTLRHVEPVHESASMAAPHQQYQQPQTQSFAATEPTYTPTHAAPQQQFSQHMARQSAENTATATTQPAPATAQPAAQPALRGQQVGGSFVAPRPLEINRTPQTSQPSPLPRTQQSTTLSLQSAIEAQDLAAQQKGGKRAESLFTRITGFGLVRPSIEQDIPPQPVQTRLNVDPNDRIPTSQNEEEDLLEIPAFLRRQTNH